MGKKSFLSRVETQGSVNGTVVNRKSADHFIKAANVVCEKIILYLASMLPGMHDLRKQARGSKKKHKGFVRSMLK